MAHLLIHRGLAKKNFSENTITAFRYCFKKNYGIETDIHCTKDNKIVCFHDFNLKGKFKINKSLKKVEYQELLKISKYKKKPIPLLKDLIKLSKNKKFNSPAFNFDEVVTLPEGAINLASNKINKIQSIHFKSGVSDVWGLQYHPEITYHKMISLIRFRKDRLINVRKCFKDEKEIQNHINFIEQEIKVSEKDSRMLELKNWLNYLKAA